MILFFVILINCSQIALLIGPELAILFHQSLLNGLQIVRVMMFASHEKVLFMHSFDLLTPPVGLALFHYFSLLFAFFFQPSDVYLLYLELHSPQLDYVVLFQVILLFHVSICYISNNQVDLFKCVTRVLELLTWLSILCVYVFWHEFFLLLLCHSLESFYLGWLNHIVISDLLHIKQDLSSLPVLFLEVLIKAVNFAHLVLADHLATFVRSELQFLTMASFVIEQALWVSIPCHQLHIQNVAT